MAANSAVVKAFWIRLLAWLCLAFLLIAALSQLKPCLPNWSTFVLPQIQGCGSMLIRLDEKENLTDLQIFFLTGAKNEDRKKNREFEFGRD